MLARTILLLIAAIGLAPVALADDCAPTTSQTQVKLRWTTVVVEIPVLGWYSVHDICQVGLVLGPSEGCLFSMPFYQESNDFPGLQRHDDFWDDTCGGEISADTLIT